MWRGLRRGAVERVKGSNKLDDGPEGPNARRVGKNGEPRRRRYMTRDIFRTWLDTDDVGDGNGGARLRIRRASAQSSM